MEARNQPNPTDEAVLIKSAAQGELEAFNQLVLSYQNIAYNHARGILRDGDYAADAVQESFIKAFQGMRDFRGGSFRGWLLRIVTNSAYDILRRSHRHPSQPLYSVDADGEEVESTPWMADPSASVESAVEAKENSKRLYEILDELPDGFRSVITLIDLYELDYTEAARILNVPLGTIKSRLARARLQLQTKLTLGGEEKRSLSIAKAGCAI